MANYADKLKDPRWQRKRLEIFQRDDFHCQLCDNSTETLAVHHKRYVSGKDPWDYENRLLITLCESCHAKLHKIKEVPKPYVDPNINPYTEKPWYNDNNLNTFFLKYLGVIRSSKPELFGCYSTSKFRTNPSSFDLELNFTVRSVQDQTRIKVDLDSLERALFHFFSESIKITVSLDNPVIKIEEKKPLISFGALSKIRQEIVNRKSNSNG